MVDNLLIKLPRWTGRVPADHPMIGQVLSKASVRSQLEVESQLSDGTTCTYPVSQSQTSHFQVSQMEVCQGSTLTRLRAVPRAWCLIDWKMMMRRAGIR